MFNKFCSMPGKYAHCVQCQVGMHTIKALEINNNNSTIIANKLEE